MRNERDIHYDAASGAWFGKSMSVPREEMEGRVWRFGELSRRPVRSSTAPCRGTSERSTARSGPGRTTSSWRGPPSSRRSTITSDFVKAPPGNGAALHSHGSEETFVALTGPLGGLLGR